MLKFINIAVVVYHSNYNSHVYNNQLIITQMAIIKIVFNINIGNY